MGRIKSLNKWANKHTYLPLDLLRIALGTFLFFKGISFMSDSQLLMDLFKPIQNLGSGMITVHYIVPAHCVGGLLIAFGLLTRWAVIAQLPILIGAIIINFAGEMNTLEASGKMQVIELPRVFTIFCHGTGGHRYGRCQEIVADFGAAYWGRSAGYPDKPNDFYREHYQRSFLILDGVGPSDMWTTEKGPHEVGTKPQVHPMPGKFKPDSFDKPPKPKGEETARTHKESQILGLVRTDSEDRIPARKSVCEVGDDRAHGGIGEGHHERNSSGSMVGVVLIFDLLVFVIQVDVGLMPQFVGSPATVEV